MLVLLSKMCIYRVLLDVADLMCQKKVELVCDTFVCVENYFHFTTTMQELVFEQWQKVKY